MTLGPNKIDTRAVEKAIEQAEREVNPPPSHWARPAFVYVPLKWITTRPDLFRVPDLDLDYVEDLATRIARDEGIDPPLMMKIGGKWICVDGHHRIAAHRKLGSHTVISEWFDGTVREAADEHLRHLRRNKAAEHPTQQGLNTASPAEKEAAKAARESLLKALRHPLQRIIRAVFVQQGSSTATGAEKATDFTEAHTVVDADTAERRSIGQLGLNQKELQAATHATLRAHATSDEAKALVAKLAAMVEDHGVSAGSRKKRRRSTAGKLEYAAGAFLANLLRAFSPEAPEPNGWVYRSMHAKGFTGSAVSYRTFAQLVEGLTGLALIEQIDGHRVSDEPGDTGKYGARFRATPALLTFCGEHGVEPTKVFNHFEFEYDLPKEPVQLRARKVGSFYSDTKPAGRPMEFERTPTVEMIESTVRELNEFFAKQTLRGGSHEGYIRLFNNGDDPHFDWNLGGRLYSQHYNESYQVLSAGKRAAMTINGEQVAEIDIRASYLTIFLSLHGIQLDTDKDPYEIEGLASSRSAVKSWMVATFGNSKPIRRWPPKMLQKSPELKDYRVATITDMVLAKYPALRAWGQPLNGRVYTWADLMWLEGSVMIGAMLDLMREHAVPSLSVHDSLIVPASKADLAAQRLARRFHAVTNVQPLLKINQHLATRYLVALRTINNKDTNDTKENNREQ